MSSNAVYRVTTKLLFAPIIVYGLYVQFHGDYGPGGGFQAGVIIAAAFILYGLVFGMDAVKTLAPPKAISALMAVGVLIYSGVGIAAMLKGGNFLDYNFLDLYNPANGQHLGIILVEFGVGVTVTSVMLGLFYAFVSYGRRNGGVK
ncbi:MAG: Na(+)/H(+) antiporter subunit B [Candidatus Puniceispirillales bacterium WSBS_2018_MAG_OTU23]